MREFHAPHDIKMLRGYGHSRRTMIERGHQIFQLQSGIHAASYTHGGTFPSARGCTQQQEPERVPKGIHRSNIECSDVHNDSSMLPSAPVARGKSTTTPSEVKTSVFSRVFGTIIRANAPTCQNKTDIRTRSLFFFVATQLHRSHMAASRPNRLWQSQANNWLLPGT